MSVTTTVTLTTFSLTNFCGNSCPDCATCCGETCGACSGIPNTLHLALKSLTFGCTATITLTWSAANSRWEGSGSVPCDDLMCGDVSDTMQFRLSCTNPGMEGFTLVQSCDNFAHFVSITSSSTVCSPIDIKFASGLTVSGNCPNCTSETYGAEVMA